MAIMTTRIFLTFFSLLFAGGLTALLVHQFEPKYLIPIGAGSAQGLAFQYFTKECRWSRLSMLAQLLVGFATGPVLPLFIMTRAKVWGAFLFLSLGVVAFSSRLVLDCRSESER